MKIFILKKIKNYLTNKKLLINYIVAKKLTQQRKYYFLCESKTGRGNAKTNH